MIFPRKSHTDSDEILLKNPMTPDTALRFSTPHILDAADAKSGYLAGQMLVATPLITDSCFHKSVVYVFNHTDEGAMGLIVNQPLEMIHFSALIEGKEFPDEAAQRDLPVYLGGPVEKTRGFVIHSTDYKSNASIMHDREIAITASSSILMDIVKNAGPKHAILTVGFAGWDAGQLEREIADNSWIHVPASSSLIFETDNEHKWGAASKLLGVDMNFYSTTVGHA